MATDDRDTLRYFKFDGDDDEWPEWKKKTLALARKKGYADALTTNLAGSSSSAEVQRNSEAYDLLLISCKKTPFGIVDRKNGNAYEAWNALIKKYEASHLMDLIHLDQEFANCKLRDASHLGSFSHHPRDHQ